MTTCIDFTFTAPITDNLEYTIYSIEPDQRFTTISISDIPIKEVTVFFNKLSKEEKRTGELRKVYCLSFISPQHEGIQRGHVSLNVKAALEMFKRQKNAELDALRQKVKEYRKALNTFSVPCKGMYKSQSYRFYIEDEVAYVNYNQLREEDKKSGIIASCRICFTSPEYSQNDSGKEDWRYWNLTIREELADFERTREEIFPFFHRAQEDLFFLEQALFDSGS